MSNSPVTRNTIEEQTLPERAAKQDGNGKREKGKQISYAFTVDGTKPLRRATGTTCNAFYNENPDVTLAILASNGTGRISSRPKMQ